MAFLTRVVGINQDMQLISHRGNAFRRLDAHLPVPARESFRSERCGTKAFDLLPVAADIERRKS